MNTPYRREQGYGRRESTDLAGFRPWGVERGPRDSRRGRMRDNFDDSRPSHSRMMEPGYMHHERRFDPNAGWEHESEGPFWEEPTRPRPDYSGPFSQGAPRMGNKNFHKDKKKMKNNFVRIQKNPSLAPAMKQHGTTKTVSQPSETASQPAEPAAMELKVKAPNADTKRREPAEKAAEINHQPDKKLKTEETAFPTDQTASDVNLCNVLSQSRDPSTTFSCPLCRFHTPDQVELVQHFQSTPHKDIVKYLYIFLPSKTMDFIQEYLLYQTSRVAQEQNRQNLHPIKDSFKGIGQEHFLHRIEVAHCQACDALVPDVPQLLSEHIKLESHIQNCKMTRKDIKSQCISAAKTILRDKRILQLLVKYSKGMNPFTDTAENAAVPAVATCEVLVAEEDDDHVDFDGDGSVDDETYTYNDKNPDDDDDRDPDQSVQENKATVQHRDENGLKPVGRDGTTMMVEEEEEAAEAP